MGGGGGEKNRIGTKKLQKSYFDVVGLCCSSEVPLIEKILKPMEGVEDVSVIVTSRTVIVLHDNLLISQLQIVKALNQARLEANIRVYGGGNNYEKQRPSPYAIACGVLLLLSFLKFVYRPFEWLALGAVAVGICPIFLRGLASLRNWTLDSNILVLIAVIGSIALHDYWEAATIVFLFTIAQWLEARASHKATAVMNSLMNIVPQKAVLAETGEEVDANAVKVNTIIAVKAGEIIPIDGIVVEGRSEVDEKTLTGESFPVSKQIDSTVFAGTINLSGYVSVRTTAPAEDCVVARMSKLVEEAQKNKSKTQMFIDKCAKIYTPVVIIISCSMVAVPFIPGVGNKNHWFHLALVVLVSACPCALILSTPVATFCALSKAATSGVLIKGGEYLETLSKIKIMAFDKTGTITRGEFVVTHFQSLSDDVTLDTLLYWVSSIESKSSHPMAAALIDYAQTLSVRPKPETVEDFENFPGEGVHGKLDGKHVYIGNRKIALRAGCSTAPSFEGHSNEGKSVGYIFLGAAPAGIFSLSDTCRSGVKEAINELKSMKIKTAMLTGDSHEAAMVAQNQLGGALDVVHDELLPEDKAKIISDFQTEARTAMVGDGVNDAPALATADIGISMGISGSALATETGHVILMSNDIRKIPKVIQLARKTQRKVYQNVFFSILTKTVVLALAFTGHPLVWAAVLADVGTCLVVIFNSMLLLKGHDNHVKCSKSSSPRAHVHKGNDKHVKCCKSSLPAAHVHKHRSNPHGCHSSHKHQHGCSDVSEAQTASGSQKCFSPRCDNKKTSNSAAMNGCCASEDHLHDSKHSGHGSTEMVTPCMASNEIHKHGCKEEECTNLVGTSHRICVSDGENHKHGGEHCNHEDNSKEIQLKQSDLNLSSSGITQSMTTEGHCHLTHCIKNPVQDHVVDRDACNVPKTGCQNTDSEACFECNGHSKENFSLPHQTTDSSLGSNHTGCEASMTCLSLEKRQIGGCCTSFRKECCGKTGHFATSIRGGLSEIIID